MTAPDDSNPPPVIDQGLPWAAKILDLERESLDQEQLKSDALAAFFTQLRDADFFPSEESTDAIKIVMGAPPMSCPKYREAIERQNLEAIDSIIQWFADRLGTTDPDELKAELRNRLSPYGSQSTLLKARKYAQQVIQAADATHVPQEIGSALAIQLGQAVFRISALRDRHRMAARTRYVRFLRLHHTIEELNSAIIDADTKFQLPNPVFHQPFFNLLTQSDQIVAEYSLPTPIVASSQSTVAYAKNFGQSDSGSSIRPSQSGNTWAWILLAVVFGVGLPPLFRFLADDIDKSGPAHAIPHTVPVIVFDKHDPNKYAIEHVPWGKSFERPKSLVATPEHPGPFVQVHISEVDPAPPDELPSGGFQVPNIDEVLKKYTTSQGQKLNRSTDPPRPEPGSRPDENSEADASEDSSNNERDL